MFLPEVMMNTTIPVGLPELKGRFDAWRKSRKYLREPIPDELRQAAAEMSGRYPSSLVRRVLKLDPSRLKKPTAKRAAHADARKKRQPAFFKLLTDAALPEPASAPQSISGCQLQLERPDGTRLTLMLPALDLISINRLCDDFLKGLKS
jgi:hypothetical protein